jgi:hypothetical protein
LEAKRFPFTFIEESIGGDCNSLELHRLPLASMRLRAVPLGLVTAATAWLEQSPTLARRNALQKSQQLLLLSGTKGVSSRACGDPFFVDCAQYGRISRAVTYNGMLSRIIHHKGTEVEE